MTIWWLRMRVACWIHEATNTHSVCNIYCFDRGTTVLRACLNDTLYIHSLSYSVQSMFKPFLPVLSNLLVKPELGAEICVGVCAGVRYCLIWTRHGIVRHITTVFSGTEFHENPFSGLDSYCVYCRMDEGSSFNSDPQACECPLIVHYISWAKYRYTSLNDGDTFWEMRR